MSYPRAYGLGDRVKLSTSCPIDFESVGPVPGTTGRVVALTHPGDFRRCLGVRFEGMGSAWAIPSRYLEPVR